jgi:NHL repeat-containing protein
MEAKRSGALVLRLIVGLALLGCARMGSAQGRWSVNSLPWEWKPGDVVLRTALAVDTAGNLYVAEYYTNRIQKRDAQGNWSVIATKGTAVGQVGYTTGLAADAAGNLYVTDYYNGIQKRDAQGNWSILAAQGASALAVDAAGNLYVADNGDDGHGNYGRIQRRDAQGNWSVIATPGSSLGQVNFQHGSGLAVDGAGNLYVADNGNNRVLKYVPGP